MVDLPSEQELVDSVTDILRNNDLEKITLRIVMSMLAERYSLTPIQLNPHKRFVRGTINEFLEKTYVPVEGKDTASNPQRQSTKRKTNPSDSATDDPGRESNTPSSKSTAAGTPAAGPKPVVKLTGLERAVVLAQPLAEFIGEVVIARSHISKRIAAYAKKKVLQDPSDGRRINCDEALKEALKVDNFTFFTLSKIVAGLVYKPEECDPELQELARQCEERTIAEKMKKREMDIANGVVPKKSAARGQKKQKTNSDKPRKPTGLFKPMQLSEALIAVVGEPQLSRSDVLKRIWQYIRENGLKDPNNGMRVLCDKKLSAVFDGQPHVSNMGINKYLSSHMTKIEEPKTEEAKLEDNVDE